MAVLSVLYTLQFHIRQERRIRSGEYSIRTYTFAYIELQINQGIIMYFLNIAIVYKYRAKRFVYIKWMVYSIPYVLNLNIMTLFYFTFLNDTIPF